MEFDAELTALIGERLGERRKQTGYTLGELAQRTGVSRAMISRIERAEVQASAVVLDRLCSGLGLTLSSLFARHATSPLLRRIEQPVWTDPESGYVRRDISPATTETSVRIVEIAFLAGAQVTFPPDRPGRFSQFVWVLEGEIEATVEGERHLLREGDCLHMRIGNGNSFKNHTDKITKYAVVITNEIML